MSEAIVAILIHPFTLTAMCFYLLFRVNRLERRLDEHFVKKRQLDPMDPAGSYRMLVSERKTRLFGSES